MKAAPFQLTFVLALLSLFLNTGCSTRYSVSQIDTTYRGIQNQPRTKSVYLTIPDDKRPNTINAPNFDRTWGYATDRGMFNVLFSSENTIASIVFDIMKGSLNSIGYEAQLIEDPGQIDPADPNRILVKTTIKELWANGKSFGYADLSVNTRISIDFQLMDLNASGALNSFSIHQNNSESRFVVSMKQVREKVEQIFADQIEQVKIDVLAEFTNALKVSDK